MRIETALAKGSMTRVERRDPQSSGPQDDQRASWRRFSPAFHWQVYFTKVGHAVARRR